MIQTSPTGKGAETAKYTHGHHASVLKAHSWRTAVNSAAFLLPHLRDGMHILDCGCGPGTITVDLAQLVPNGRVIGLEYAPDVLKQAEAHAASKGVSNVAWQTGDVHALPFEDDSFDVVYAHQVLQHVGDPVQALREMKRVTKSGGIVAARDSDYESFAFYPSSKEMYDWKALYMKVARGNGGEPNAGRMLHTFARRAGFDATRIEKSSSTWCYSTREEVEWWSGVWAERSLKSNFAKGAIEQGATQADVEKISETWKEWGQNEDAWFMVPHGEIIAHV